MRPIAIATLAGLLSAGQALASDQPYIDLLKRDLPRKESAEPEGYINSVREKVGTGGSSEGYSERLRSTDPQARTQGSPEPASSYTEQVRQGLEQKPEGGAIAAVHEGRSELRPKVTGEIHNAVGFRYGGGLKRDITAEAGVQKRSYADVYGASSSPEVALFYEYQPFHSEWFGNLGIYGSLGVGYASGTGTFEKTTLVNPTRTDGSTFSSQSRTKLQFFTIPVTVGLDYRFNLLRIVRPFVIAGPTLIGYLEKRSDEKSGHKGYSRGLTVAGGASLLLDWISRGSTWDLYSQYSIKHYYLTVEYSRLATLAGDVDFTVSGITAGLTFEF